MKHATVSIGIVTYNAEDTVRDALESALAQSTSIRQIVVVDDRSTDRTMSIIEEYADRSTIEIHQNSENCGVAVARNEIIKRANGDFLTFFDDDDVSASNRVERQLNRILEYEKIYSRG